MVAVDDGGEIVLSPGAGQVKSDRGVELAPQGSAVSRLFSRRVSLFETDACTMIDV